MRCRSLCMILICEHLVPMSSLLTTAFSGSQKSISHEHRQCTAFNPLHGGVMFAGTSDYTDFLFLTSGKKKKNQASGNQQAILFTPIRATTDVHSYRLNSICLLCLGQGCLPQLCIWGKENHSPLGSCCCTQTPGLLTACSLHDLPHQPTALRSK